MAPNDTRTTGETIDPPLSLDRLETGPWGQYDTVEDPGDGDLVRFTSVDDGRCYAYRWGNQHIVVYDGADGSWARRVPAERSAVLPLERIWTIPDNWISMSRADDRSRPSIYRIDRDEPVHVKVQRQYSVPVAEYWIKVVTVGDLYDDGTDVVNRDTIEDYPDNFFVDALIELGATPSEATDYVDVHGRGMSVEDRARTAFKDPDEVTQSIEYVKTILGGTTEPLDSETTS